MTRERLKRDYDFGSLEHIEHLAKLHNKTTDEIENLLFERSNDDDCDCSNSDEF